GRGLMCAFSLAEGVQRAELLRNLVEAGVVMLPCGTRSIRFRPTLDITKEALDDGLDRLEKVLKAIQR
ncbi:MAG: aminotransferase class III-fold pyridoxal phosphate-dependent enzyme, partial [Candidatus Eisenbacteria bacterium]|nr:aminotransferase class III-fold pyridoxal phosphate-dependent enzyme [Candidatus Eisenbacteria bacterium]